MKQTEDFPYIAKEIVELENKVKTLKDKFAAILDKYITAYDRITIEVNKSFAVDMPRYNAHLDDITVCDDVVYIGWDDINYGYDLHDYCSVEIEIADLESFQKEGVAYLRKKLEKAACICLKNKRENAKREINFLQRKIDSLKENLNS